VLVLVLVLVLILVLVLVLLLLSLHASSLHLHAVSCRVSPCLVNAHQATTQLAICALPASPDLPR